MKKTKLPIASLALLLLLIVSMLAITDSAYARVVNINNQELGALISQGVAVVDIRTEGEWRETGVIRGSHLLTLFNEEREIVDPHGWLKRVNEVVPPGRPIIVICRIGNRTIPTSSFLSRSGYHTVYNAADGIETWIKSGGEIVSY